MSFPGAIAASLVSLARRLDVAEVRYGLAGSCMVSLLGGDVSPHDIDITVEAGDRDRLVTALEPGDVVEMPLEGAVWRNAWWLRTGIEGVQVDIIGGPAIHVGGRGVALSPFGTKTCRFAGTTVWLADPAEWVYVYRLIDPTRAAILEEIVDSEHIDALRDRFGAI